MPAPTHDHHAGTGGLEGARVAAVHASLVRPVLHLGVERPVIALEATLCGALLLGVGPNALTIGCAVLVCAVVHPAMVWLTGRDSQTAEVYLRSRGYADYYAPHAAAHVRGRRPRASVPLAR